MELAKSDFFDISSYSRYSGAVDAAIVPLMSYLLLGAGFFFMAYFFVYEVTSTKSSRQLQKEILVASLAAVFLGIGTVFTCILVGIYV